MYIILFTLLKTSSNFLQGNANCPALLTYQRYSFLPFIPSPSPSSTLISYHSVFHPEHTLRYNSNNVRGQWKRALTSATLVGGGSIGGIIGTTVFRAKDAPNYRPGMLATLIANALIVLIVIGLSIKFHRANKRVDAGGKPIEGLVGFKYTL